jgi:SAM-dependent methyltransferase
MPEAAVASPDQLPYWERAALESRFVAYTSQLQLEFILYGHELASPPSVALDFGCEAGRFSRVLAQRGWSLICVDINHHALELRKQRNPGARCISVTEDNGVLACEDHSLGILLCIEVPVITSEWFIDEASRALRPGGVLVGTFPNQLSWRGVMGHWRAVIRGRFDWYSRTYPEWRRALSKRGFTFLRETGCRWPPFTPTSNSMLLPLALAVEQALGLPKLISVSPLVIFAARKERTR